jgi:hypothetical protein
VHTVSAGVLPELVDVYTSTSTFWTGLLEVASVTVPEIWPPACIAASIDEVVDPAVTDTTSEPANDDFPL